MKKSIKQERLNAVQRFFNGEEPEEICDSLGRPDHGCTNGLCGMPPMIRNGLKIIRVNRYPVPIEPQQRSKRLWRWFG